MLCHVRSASPADENIAAWEKLKTPPITRLETRFRRIVLLYKACGFRCRIEFNNLAGRVSLGRGEGVVGIVEHRQPHDAATVLDHTYIMLRAELETLKLNG